MEKLLSWFKPLPDAPRIESAEEIARQYKYWRIRTFLALYIGYCAFYVTRKNLTPALHVFSENLGIDIVDLGIISATFSITYGVGKLLAGILADKANVRAFMAIGLLLSGVINLFYGFLTSLWALAFFWGLNGFCQATGYPPVAKSLVYWFSPRERAKIWSWWSSSHTAGTFAAGGIIALLLKYCNDWRAVFYVPGIIGIVIAIYIFWSLRDTPTSVGLPPIEEYKNDIIPVTVDKKAKESQWTILKKYVFGNPYVWYLSLALSFVYFVRFGTLDWATKFLYDARGIDKVSVVWLWNLMPLFGMPGGIVAGYLASKFFKGRCAPVTIAYLVILALCTYGYVIFAGASHLWLTCFFMAAIGFFVDGPQVLIGGVMISRVTAQESAGAAAGFSGFWAYILGTAVLANMGAAFLVEKYGWDVMYYTCIASAVVAILFVALSAKKESVHPDEIKK
ncbi:MAG: MFS transporter [Elusimicrobiaceae bacterium]|nr:MFS transporter [Elusimicrobiaceae bacterium]